MLLLTPFEDNVYSHFEDNVYKRVAFPIVDQFY